MTIQRYQRMHKVQKDLWDIPFLYFQCNINISDYFFILQLVLYALFESHCENTYLLTSTPNGDANQPEHPRSLIRSLLKLHPWQSKMRTVNILTRLRECAGWFESSLGAHIQRYVFWHCGSFDFLFFIEHCMNLTFIDVMSTSLGFMWLCTPIPYTGTPAALNSSTCSLTAWEATNSLE